MNETPNCTACGKKLTEFERWTYFDLCTVCDAIRKMKNAQSPPQNSTQKDGQ